MAALWLKPAGGLLHDAPRQLQWSVPDTRRAKAAHSVLSDGRIRIEISHLPLVAAAVNGLIRGAVYQEAMSTQWRRHQLEEVGLLQHLLAQCYNSTPQGNLCRL